jgi:hypothetical protein
MANTLIAPIVNNQQFLANGSPANGAKLFSYAANTTTKQPTYADLAGSSQNANPIVLDAGGNIPASGEVRLTAGVAYKFVLAPANDTDPPASPYWTKDYVSGVTDSSSVTASEWNLGPTPTYISANSFSLVGDQTAVFTVGRRVKTVNTGGTLYGTVISATYSSVTTVVIAVDGVGSIDSGLSSVSYGILNAVNDSVPETILHTVSAAWRNRIFNGLFEIDDLHNFGTYNPTNGDFVAARWKYVSSQAAKIEAIIAAYTGRPAWASEALSLVVVSQYSPGAGESFLLQQQVKGVNIEDFQLGVAGNTQVFTLSFAVRATVAGVYAVSFRNASSNRSYVATYTIASPSVWQNVQISVPSDATGTWAVDETVGLSVSFDMGSGANYATTAGSWQAGDFRTVAGAVQTVDQANNSVFYITDIVLEMGPVATYPREKRPRELEKLLCAHYHVVYPAPGVASGTLSAQGPAVSTTVANLMLKLPIRMRAAPTLSVLNATNFSVYDGVNSATAASSIAAGTLTNESAQIAVTVASGLTQYRNYALTPTNANAQLVLSAEL